MQLEPRATGEALLGGDFASDAIAIWQDQRQWRWSELGAEVEQWRDKLKPYAGLRVAMVASRADRIAVVVMAAERVGCELLLLRSELPVDSPLLTEWGVAAMLHDNGDIVATGVRTVFGEGPHVLLTTSGTTGTPKVARHSLASLLGKVSPASHVRANTHWLLTYHPATFGGFQVVLTWLRCASRMTALDGGTAAALAARARQAQPTHISGTPTFWRAFLMALGENAGEIQLRQITLGGEIVDQPLLDQLAKTFPGAAITHIYASTEAGALFGVKDQRAGFPSEWLATGIDGVELRIRDDMLEVRSPRSMTSYVGATAPPMSDDGWISTGDCIKMDGDRALFNGRRDSMFSVGGAKVTPEEVEEALLRIPGILEAYVYPVKNPVTTNLVAADLVCEAGVDFEEHKRIIRRSLSDCLEPHKLPRLLRVVEAIKNSGDKKVRRL